MADARADLIPFQIMCTSAPATGSTASPTPSSSGSRFPTAGRSAGWGLDKYQADHSDSPGIPPCTTIRWRLWHLIENYGGIRNPQRLGVERQPAGFERDDPAPATAAEAIIALERAHAFWQGLLHELPADSWWEPLGPVSGPFAEDDKASLVLHQRDEQIHHGAELGGAGGAA